MSNKERAAIALLVVGGLILARGSWVYLHQWMQDTCPCCNLDAKPFDTVRLLASGPIPFIYRYFWQITALRWAKGAEDVQPMTLRERNARLVAVLVSAIFTSFAYGYLKGSMRAACPCCNIRQWPFALACCLAALMIGMTVNYFLGLAIGPRAKKSKG
jgi:hypothetical protein